MKVCKHGSLKRVCPICELEADNKRLEKVCADLNKIIREQRRQILDIYEKYGITTYSHYQEAE